MALRGEDEVAALVFCLAGAASGKSSSLSVSSAGREGGFLTAFALEGTAFTFAAAALSLRTGAGSDESESSKTIGRFLRSRLPLTTVSLSADCDSSLESEAAFLRAARADSGAGDGSGVKRSSSGSPGSDLDSDSGRTISSTLSQDVELLRDSRLRLDEEPVGLCGLDEDDGSGEREDESWVFRAAAALKAAFALTLLVAICIAVRVIACCLRWGDVNGVFPSDESSESASSAGAAGSSLLEIAAG